MVDRLLAFKAQLDEVLSESFASSQAFASQLTSALQSAVNSRSNKPAELVAKWIDAKLRSSKGLSETDLEADLDRALVLFGYIQVRTCGTSSDPPPHTHTIEVTPAGLGYAATAFDTA